MSAEHFKRLRGVYRSALCGPNGDLHPAGKEVIANLRDMTKFGQSPFSSDAVTMAYRVGQQDVFRHFMSMLNISDAEIYRLTNTVNDQEGRFTDD